MLKTVTYVLSYPVAYIPSFAVRRCLTALIAVIAFGDDYIGASRKATCSTRKQRENLWFSIQRLDAIYPQLNSVFYLCFSFLILRIKKISTPLIYLSFGSDFWWWMFFIGWWIFFIGCLKKFSEMYLHFCPYFFRVIHNFWGATAF